MAEAEFHTPLGDFRIIEVYGVYDVPRLFACQSNTGQLYVCLWVEEQADADRWLLLPVSRGRLRTIRNGEISLREALVRAEDGVVLSITTPFKESAGTVSLIPCHAIPEDDLPDPGAKIAVEPDFEVVEHAIRSGRATLDLYLQRDEGVHEIESEPLGKLLQSCQRLFYAIAYGGRGLWGRMPTEVREQATLVVEEVFSSSVGVRLTVAQPNQSTLSVLDRGTHALQTFGELLKQISDAPEVVRKYGPRVATHFRGFIGALAEARAGVVASWAAPYGEARGWVRLNSEEVGLAVDALSNIEFDVEEQQEIITVHGTLEGVSARKGTFELLDQATGERIRGKLEPGLSDRTRFIVKARCQAAIRVTSRWDLSAGIEQVSFTLVEIEQ